MDEQQIIRRRKILAILLATSFILIVIVAGVVISLLNNDDFGVNIKNEDSLKSENKDITLDSNDMKALREHIRSISEVPDDEEINIQFNSSVSPCLIKPISGNDYEYLVLPVRITNN